MTFSQPFSEARFGKAWARFVLHRRPLKACLSMSTLRLSLPKIGVELGLVPKTPKSLLLIGKLQESLPCRQPPANREACRVQSSPSRPAPSCPPSWALWMCPPRKCPSNPCSDHSAGGRCGRRENDRRSPHFLLHKAIFKPPWCFYAACAVLNVTMDPFGCSVGVLAWAT